MFPGTDSLSSQSLFICNMFSPVLDTVAFSSYISVRWIILYLPFFLNVLLKKDVLSVAGKKQALELDVQGF